MSQDKDIFTVYRPNQRHDLGYIQTWILMTRNIIRSRDLIWQLFKRDYFATYKKSFIGLTWVILSPIIGILSWVFLKKTGMLNPGDVGVPYPVYVLIGSSIWGLFMGTFTSVSQTLEASQMIIVQVNFPREALVFKQVAIQAVNFSISFLVNLAVLIGFGVVPSINTLLLPVVALPLLLFATAIGLIVSMISVVAFDMNRFIAAVMGLFLYTIPVIYSDQVTSHLAQLVIRWNPLTYLVCSPRDIVLYGRIYDPAGYFICTALAGLLFIVSLRLFYIAENKIIERML
jgi:lipopolysaccharide transport system permease protein